MTAFDAFNSDAGLFLPEPEPAQDFRKRLRLLDELRLGAAETVFDDFAAAMARDFATEVHTGAGVPYAMVNFVTDRQVFAGLHSPADKSEVGRTMGLDHGYCPAVVRRRLPLVLSDVCAFPRFGSNPVVDKVGIATYTGAPLILNDTVLGTVCVLNTSPRSRATNRQAHEFITSRRDALMDLITQRTGAGGRHSAGYQNG